MRNVLHPGVLELQVRGIMATILSELRKFRVILDRQDGKIVRATLKSEKSRDALPLLAGLEDLKELHLWGLSIKGDEYAPLAKLAGLVSLSISACGTPGKKGMYEIGKLGNLQKLKLERTGGV